MKILKNNREGFGTVELVLAIVIVILLVVVGWLIYKNNEKNTPVSTTSTSTSASSSGTQAVGSVQSAATRAQIITNGLLDATKGTSTFKGVTPAIYVNDNVSNGYFTASFKAAVDKGSVLTSGAACSSNMPTSFGTGRITLSGSAATVQLTMIANGAYVTSSYPMIPQITLQYTNNNWSISGYTCITNPTQS
ncbi:MAG TPA: hypothetical protein VMR08_01360 [Patescibacteria group bacterium]|jgi:cytoskeletal protein RodZ|nr:hypothetical protein [Patescibacteria group bacterium]